MDVQSVLEKSMAEPGACLRQVAAGGRLILLDDEGKLTLATPTSDGLEVHAEAGILSSPALTPPTLDGTVLYARDQHDIVALELGSSRR